MNDQETTAFSKAILERALSHHSQHEGNLGPTDPLDIAGVKSVAAELDVPATYVDAALAQPVLHRPTRANDYTLIAERYMAASPDTVLPVATSFLMKQFQFQAQTPILDGYAFTPLDGAAPTRDLQHIESLDDITLTCVPYPPRLGTGYPTSTPGAILRFSGRIGPPGMYWLISAFAAGVAFGPIPGLLLTLYTPVSNELGGIIAFIGIPVVGAYSAYIANRFRTRSIARMLRYMAGTLNGIARAMPTDQPETTSRDHPDIAEQAGGFFGRFIRSFQRESTPRRVNPQEE